jgi:hypothetical protein
MKTVRTCVGIVGLVVAFVVALGACNRIRNAYGDQTVGVIAFALGAAWVATKESRELARKVVRALERAGMSMKEAAAEADMDFGQLSRQLCGCTEQMSMSRYAKWKPAFWLAFASEVAEGQGAVVIQNEHLAEIALILRPLVDRRERAA